MAAWPMCYAAESIDFRIRDGVTMTEPVDLYIGPSVAGDSWIIMTSGLKKCYERKLIRPQSLHRILPVRGCLTMSTSNSGAPDRLETAG